MDRAPSADAQSLLFGALAVRVRTLRLTARGGAWGGREKMVEGRLGKIAKELALLEQPFIKDTTKTVGEHIKEAVAAIGENIQVRSAQRTRKIHYDLKHACNMHRTCCGYEEFDSPTSMLWVLKPGGFQSLVLPSLELGFDGIRTGL